MTSEDIRKVTFEKTMRGYRPEDVDDFLNQAAASMDELTMQMNQLSGQINQLNAEKESLSAERDAALASVGEMENKMFVLAEKVEEYRDQEDTLKTALINAQRMGETVVHEAKQKADNMIREATGTTELLRQQAEQDIAREQLVLEKMQVAVARFKSTVLNLYKQHIESLSALDAPVEKISEFIEENGFERIEEPPEGLLETGGHGVLQREDADEELEESASAVVYEDEEEEEEPAEQEPVSAVNLFEGVQIDNESE